MISTSFGYGERESIASAYSKMYAPKRMNESCCKVKKVNDVEKKEVSKLPTKHCEPSKTGSKLGVRKVMPFDKRDPKPSCAHCAPVKKVEKAGVKKVEKLVGGTKEVKHKVPSKTGSKLGVRKVMPFDKRDPKSSASKYAPKAKKVTESAKCFCIVDGERTLCTNDIGESYFNKGGITGDTRIYESRIDAMKDIKKVGARRKAKDKYRVRGCQKIGESIEFVGGGQPVNEGLFDGIVKGVGSVGRGLGNAVGNLVQLKPGEAVNDVIGGVTGAVGNVAGGAWDTLSKAGNAAVQGFKDASATQQPAAKPVAAAPAQATAQTTKAPAQAAAPAQTAAQSTTAAAAPAQTTQTAQTTPTAATASDKKTDTAAAQTATQAPAAQTAPTTGATAAQPSTTATSTTVNTAEKKVETPKEEPSIDNPGAGSSDKNDYDPTEGWSDEDKEFYRQFNAGELNDDAVAAKKQSLTKQRDMIDAQIAALDKKTQTTATA